MSFVARQAFSVVRVQIHNRNSEFLRFFSDLCVHPFRHGLLPGPPGHCRLPPSSERVRFVSEYLYRAWMDSKLYRFGACRFRPGLIPQGTQGLQASAKGTACSRVLTRPESESSFDPLFRLPMTMSAP